MKKIVFLVCLLVSPIAHSVNWTFVGIEGGQYFFKNDDISGANYGGGMSFEFQKNAELKHRISANYSKVANASGSKLFSDVSNLTINYSYLLPKDIKPRMRLWYGLGLSLMQFSETNRRSVSNNVVTSRLNDKKSLKPGLVFSAQYFYRVTHSLGASITGEYIYQDKKSSASGISFTISYLLR